jgi:transposase
MDVGRGGGAPRVRQVRPGEHRQGRPPHQRGRSSGEAEHVAGEVDDADGLAHLEHGDVAPQVIQERGLEDELDGLRYGHEIPVTSGCVIVRGWLGFVDTYSHEERKESTMAKRLTYPPEYRQQMVDLVGAGRTPEELSRGFEPAAQTIRNRVRKAEGAGGGAGEGVSAQEQEELKRLRRENKQWRLEREILARAAAWFAGETDAVPPKSSNS